MGLLQVLETGGAKPGLLLQHGARSSTCIRGRGRSGLLAGGPKYPSLRVWGPVLARLCCPLDHIVRDRPCVDLIIHVLVVHWAVCCPPAFHHSFQFSSSAQNRIIIHLIFISNRYFKEKKSISLILSYLIFYIYIILINWNKMNYTLWFFFSIKLKLKFHLKPHSPH